MLPCPGEILELSSELLTAMAMVRIMVDDLVCGLLQDGLILLPSDLLCPDLSGLFGWEMLLDLAVLALS